MKAFRIAMIALAAIQLLIAGYGALVGGFADGGGLWWERWALLVVHPVAAVALVALVSLRRPHALLSVAVMALLLFNIAVDALLSGAIIQGYTRGNWELPLVFAIIPVIGLIFAVTRWPQNRLPGRPTRPVAA